MRTKKLPHEKGYLIPIKRKIATGKYTIGYVKQLISNPNTTITVCLPSGKTTTWSFSKTIHVPQGFKRVENFSRLKNSIFK